LWTILNYLQVLPVIPNQILYINSSSFSIQSTILFINSWKEDASINEIAIKPGLDYFNHSCLFDFYYWNPACIIYFTNLFYPCIIENHNNLRILNKFFSLNFLNLKRSQKLSNFLFNNYTCFNNCNLYLKSLTSKINFLSRLVPTQRFNRK